MNPEEHKNWKCFRNWNEDKVKDGEPLGHWLCDECGQPFKGADFRNICKVCFLENVAEDLNVKL